MVYIYILEIFGGNTKKIDIFRVPGGLWEEGGTSSQTNQVIVNDTADLLLGWLASRTVCNQ